MCFIITVSRSVMKREHCWLRGAQFAKLRPHLPTYTRGNPHSRPTRPSAATTSSPRSLEFKAEAPVAVSQQRLADLLIRCLCTACLLFGLKGAGSGRSAGSHNDDALLKPVRRTVDERPTYCYRRITDTLVHRKFPKPGSPPVNRKLRLPRNAPSAAAWPWI